MLRRDFLRRSARTLSAAFLAANPVARAALIDPEPLPKKLQASDEVVLGHTGIRTSRLAMGTGTIGYGGAFKGDLFLGPKKHFDASRGRLRASAICGAASVPDDA